MLDIKLVYPYDPRGDNPLNLISDERHKLSAIQGEDYMFIVPRKSPFLSKDLKLVDNNTKRTLILNKDYKIRKKYLGNHINDCYLLIEIINTELYDSVIILEYRTLGGDTILDHKEVIEYLARREIEPRSIHWSKVLNKKGKYDSEPHVHPIQDFIGFDDLYKAAEVQMTYLDQLLENTEALLQEHIETENAHNLTLLHLNLNRLENFFSINYERIDANDLTKEEKKMFVSASSINKYLSTYFAEKGTDVQNSLEGPKEARQGNNIEWTITDFDSFSTYEVNSTIGTFTVVDDKIKASFTVSDVVGNHDIIVVKNDIPIPYPFVLHGVGIQEPILIGIDDGDMEVALRPTLNSSVFKSIPEDIDELKQIKYQIARDRAFNILAYSQTVTSQDPIEVPALDRDTRYYARVKHIGNIAESDWSNIVEFNTVDILSPIVANTGYTSIYGKDEVNRDRYGHDFVVQCIVPQEYIDEQNVDVISMSLYKVTETNELEEIANTGLKYIDYNMLEHTTSWCPLQNVPNSVRGPYASDGVKYEDSKFEDDALYVVKSKLRLADGTWSDWSEQFLIKTAIREIEQRRTYVEKLRYSEVQKREPVYGPHEPGYTVITYTDPNWPHQQGGTWLARVNGELIAIESNGSPFGWQNDLIYTNNKYTYYTEQDTYLYTLTGGVYDSRHLLPNGGRTVHVDPYTLLRYSEWTAYTPVGRYNSYYYTDVYTQR